MNKIYHLKKSVFYLESQEILYFFERKNTIGPRGPPDNNKTSLLVSNV